MLIARTSRNSERQKEQLKSVTAASLSDEQVQATAEAGKGRFYPHFQAKVWDAAKP
jgi:hypothetical protein